MKQTEFKFGLRVDAENGGNLLDELSAVLGKIDGVCGVAMETRSCVPILAVKASFVDSEDAKRIHRKIMKTLMRQAGISISSAESNLTDIFG
jgi:hypothetical protein